MILKNLKKYTILLASQSPRRQELLYGLDLEFKIIKNCVEEVYPRSLDKLKIPEYLAEIKADAHLKNIDSNQLVITADTIVIIDNQVLEKPKDKNEAIDMLSMLSGESHKVVTGVCLATKNKKSIFSDQTIVTFDQLSAAEIEYYVEKYKPFDKAGSYGAQEWLGYVAISKLEGSYFNVMGLPVHRLFNELKKF